MKPLEVLSNVERGKLLYELFPGEIPAAVDFIRNLAITIAEEPERMRPGWNNELFTFESWLRIIEQVQAAIGRDKERLYKSSRLFSEQLFAGYSAMYSAYALTVYVTDRKHPNEKFATMVCLLFEFQPII